MTKKAAIKEPDRVLIAGKPDLEQCDNKVVSARYTPVTFFPKAIAQQFRRFANVYFLVVGIIMFIGQYFPDLFSTAISPWTTLGPLAFVISVSLVVEGISDYKRHQNDHETNNAPCVILRRSDELDAEEGAERTETICGGKDIVVNMKKMTLFGAKSVPERKDTDPSHPSNVKVAYQNIRRKDIRQGHFVLVRNREMVPADMVLLASSNDQGGAYIETSSIDGETNLKLRNSPHLPKAVIKALREGNPLESITEEVEKDKNSSSNDTPGEKVIETVDAATKRLTRISYLGNPNGTSVLDHPDIKNKLTAAAEDSSMPESSEVDAIPYDDEWGNKSKKNVGQKIIHGIDKKIEKIKKERQRFAKVDEEHGVFVAALTTEPPNASVHTFSGKLTLPPLSSNGPCYEIPLGAETVVLRGAVIRNTEWVIGLAFFTGTDTKLVRNSFDTPAKFSQLDQLINRTVVAILIIMILCIMYLATEAVKANDEQFDSLFYVGFNTNSSEVWPYLPSDFEPPEWKTAPSNWLQFFFLYVTLLNNFIPLSMYVSIEMVQFCMLIFVYSDLDMYDDTTNTRAVARSTIMSDLGRIQYIFSDKTGTLTQNVMRFKRCSVDGMVFGAPIQKARVNAEKGAEAASRFHPLRQLVVGRFKQPPDIGLQGLGGTYDSEMDKKTIVCDNKLTFNAEMFLRVMSLCHTVVVEKDIDKNEQISSAISTTSAAGGSLSTYAKTLFKGRKRADTGSSVSSPLGSVAEEADFDPTSPPNLRLRANTGHSSAPGDESNSAKNSDGAPSGYAYQAESPDEGALVSAASSIYDFQVIARDTNGIRLRCNRPSHLQESNIVEGLKAKSIRLNQIAAETCRSITEETSRGLDDANDLIDPSVNETREEVWTILAVNKFDSDRKRMSILLRSPPELGSLPILFCKGADSSMIDPEICGKRALIDKVGRVIVPNLATVSEAEDEASGEPDTEDWDMTQMLEMQVHLGEFAKEGLRTLVLGVRVLTETECSEWLEEYSNAATSMRDRDALLTEAAKKVEKDLHIVGATAIEDKLQRRVPETIATLGQAGIKLWVLTGDKRETAVEIGYSTNVLTSKMHLTEVPDKGLNHVRTQMAMEFIRLIKIGRLQEYQMSTLTGNGSSSWKSRFADFVYAVGKWKRSIRRSTLRLSISIYRFLGMKVKAMDKTEYLLELLQAEKQKIKDVERRKIVRERADKTIQDWLKSEEGMRHRRASKGTHVEGQDLTLASEETPLVFVRATSAQGILNEMSGDLSQPELRQLSIAHLTAHQAGIAEQTDEEPIVDEDTLSLESFVPGGVGDAANDFDRKKRTLLERMFAVDRAVRKGQLMKHLKKERFLQIIQGKEVIPETSEEVDANNRNAARALVIEGAALKHLLGDPEFEEILFAVASNCDAVIACRVSPRQKALLVGLVRRNVKPEPITLAIGDGANDVGMIQEAHVGVGISGKEGKQAVNASDFAIAQFRFLETLILIHGRWDFFRLASVTMFSFYKNAVMAGTIIIFTDQALYSGTPLYDEWVLAMLNFVAAWPIIFTGLFDRVLSKEYVRKNPEVYRATRENELITYRTLLRWIILVFIHVFMLYNFTVPQQAYGGGVSPAFNGLMRFHAEEESPGDGEGGDLKSVGTVTFTCLIFLLAYKVLYETRSLIHGVWPAFTCRKGVGEGWPSRLAYTWHGITWLSIFFYFFAILTYQLVGRKGANQFSGFVMTANHVLGTRSMTWMLILFVPVIAIVVDVCGKVFSNMFFPTQTQIHLEKEALGKMHARRQGLPSSEAALRRRQARQRAEEV